MPTAAELSRALVELLDLEHVPIAINFEASLPAEARRFDAPPPAAACVFWMHAHEDSFVTVPADHANCSVGRFTHGLAEAADIVGNDDVGALLEVGWVTLEAFSGVAHLSYRPEAISYGPLSECINEPDVVMLRLSPRQMMEISDALPVEFSGKPQCQILPRAVDRQVIAASMGCALSRARTGMSDNEMTCAIPGTRVAELVEALTAVRQANDAVAHL
jgi:uncharacterized protein (DUF169 family)